MQARIQDLWKGGGHRKRLAIGGSASSLIRGKGGRTAGAAGAKPC